MNGTTTKTATTSVRWSELSEEKKAENLRKTNRLFDYLKSNLNKMVTWNQVNDKLRLDHVYRFKIDDYNAVHKWSQIVFDEKGIVCVGTKK